MPQTPVCPLWHLTLTPQLLVYILGRVTFVEPVNWVWPYNVLAFGLIGVVWMLLWNHRQPGGEDIDDVAELLIRTRSVPSDNETRVL